MGSLYKDFVPNPTSNIGNFITQLNQFRSTLTGNPEAQVKQLLQSGRMSQDKFNELAQTATQLRQLIK